ncbi:MAG: efflux RND transporter periplasmic adaptor subunit [Thermoguttaceae bacterium]|nr:efflux RND transporter periplasmic adaptor subunit [Thermoguttaceae bacterium]
MRFFRLGFVIFTFVLAAAPVCFGQAPGMAMKPTPLLVAKVAETVPSLSREYRGSAEAIETVNVIARVSGLLEKVNFKEGTIVEKGALLFNIEDTEYAANLSAAKAQVSSCESTIKQNAASIIEIQAKIKYAQANYNRCKQLFEKGGAGSEDDVDNALATLDSLKAQLEAAQAALTNAQAQLELAKSKVEIAEFDFSHTTIHSPIKGRAGRLTYTQGNYITPNNGALVSIAQLDPIYIRFSISETDFVSLFESADGLRNETELKIRLADNSEYKGKGKISFIDNKVTNLDTIQVWAEFENPDGLLNPGGIAKVILTKPGSQSYPSIPASGLMHDDRGEFVYVVVENKLPDGTPVANLRKRQIIIGPADGNTQCVVKGLEPGEIVVIGGSNKVNPLMIVDENGACAANPQMPALPVMPVFDQETLIVEEQAAEQAAAAAPAPAQDAGQKAPKGAGKAAKPNGGAAQ